MPPPCRCWSSGSGRAGQILLNAPRFALQVEKAGRIALAEAFCKKYRGFFMLPIWMGGSACLRGGESSFAFSSAFRRGSHAGPSVQTAKAEPASAPPARSRVARRAQRALADPAVGKGAARRVLLMRREGDSCTGLGTLGEGSPARVPAAAGCQPRCRFKAKPEGRMVAGQLRLHNLFWV